MRARARLAALLGLNLLLLAAPIPAIAHGIVGGRADLPVPLEFFLYGAGIVLVVSFVAIGVLWTKPRLQGGPQQRVLGGSWLRPLAGVLRVIGLLVFVLVILAGLSGSNTISRNIAPVLVWVVFWLAMPFLGALVGNLWAPINPWRTIGELSRIGGRERHDLLTRWGVWPAALAFLAFTWLELVYPDPGSPRTLGVAALVYTLYIFAMMTWAGRTTGLQVGDAFTTYNRLISGISPFGRTEKDQLVWRGWLRALPAVPQWSGLTMFVVLMIGTVTYDGLSSTPWWRDIAAGMGFSSSEPWLGTLALIGTVALIGAGYWQASWAAVQISGESDRSPSDVARSFAHTLVPIGLAYAVAHYFTLVIFEGQLLLSTLSDPFALGWNLFGTANWKINYWLPPTGIWYVQVAVIVTGHVVAVILAHDRALAEFPPDRAFRTQYAMLAVMVGLTVLGLTILAAG